jgi:hypothetical protein
MSQVDTTNIDINFPVPRANNNSNGFRNNFSSIKTALNQMDLELSELQAFAIVKNALTDTSLANNMNGALIKNNQFKGTRKSVTDLGDNLTGNVIINVNASDVYIGTIAANSTITIQFAGWSPSGTKSEVELNFKFLDHSSKVDFTDTKIDSSINFLGNATNKIVSPFYGYDEITLNFSTIDCGKTIQVVPIINTRKETNMIVRTPSFPIGTQTDVIGHTCVDQNYLYVCTSTYDGITAIWKRAPLINI